MNVRNQVSVVPKLGICPILRLGKPNLEFQVWAPTLRLGKPNLESAMLPNLKIGQIPSLSTTYLLASRGLGIGSFLLHTTDHGSGIFLNNICFPASNICGVRSNSG